MHTGAGPRPDALFLTAALLLAIPCACAAPSTYYVAANGSDRSDGRRATRPWRTLERVNAARLVPGDTVRFRRGDTWRGSLRPQSGASGLPVTYAAYGQGPKPALLGSVSRSDPRVWRHEGGLVWSTGGTPVQRELPPPPVRGVETSIRWSLYVENGAAASGTPKAGAASPAAFRVECAAPGHLQSDMQLSTVGIRLQQGHAYRLMMKVRAGKPFRLVMPTLMRAGPPWTGYSSGPALRPVHLGTDWEVLCQYYTANVTTTSARLTVYLGDAMPAGGALEIDRCSFEECPLSALPADSVLPVDVGNVIMSREHACGVKVWRRADLDAPGKYWYDADDRRLYLCSDTNPAAKWRSIECALYRHIVDESGASYVVYQDLALRYGGAHGIGGGSTHHITVRDCEISYIGGANQFGGTQTVRFGNGIEFWGDAHDNLVERCRLWEIYDAALTNQNMGGTAAQERITYRNNVIWNSEYSFEYWNRPGSSRTRDIRFVHNTCVGAGRGWAHAQRPDPSGRHLCFYTSEADESGIVVANNIMCDATGNAFYAPTWSRAALERLRMEGNVWYQPAGTMVSVCGSSYPMAGFARYQREYANETGSRAGVPRFVDAAHRDFHLGPGSPAIGAGVPLGVRFDFDRRPRPGGRAPDAGAFAYGAR